MRFLKNFHVAKKVDLWRCDRMIANYPQHFSTPKYLNFIRTLLIDGWDVRLHEVKHSKYVFVSKADLIFKIRFSNHKPIYSKEMENDCDFYVGISHKQVSTTDEIIKKIKEEYDNTL